MLKAAGLIHWKARRANKSMDSERKKRTPTELIEHYASRRDVEREHPNCAKCHHAYLLAKICSRLKKLGRESAEDWSFARKLQVRLWQHSKYFKFWKALADKGLSQEKIEEQFRMRGWRA